MKTLTSYDELPYDSLPLPETQPDFLAAVARLHGFQAPDPATARILELGCAQGGNLIPLAARWPEATCVGVELSQVQAEAGAAFIRDLGLHNVRILHGNLAALPPDLGEFDYIIAHGVYSWVPADVQQALLAVCRGHLAPQGVAYVSFNVAAGWEKLLPLRAALIERTAADLPAPARYGEARAVLDDLARIWTGPQLLKEIAYLKSAAPSYLFHEYLAEFNAPIDFETFVAKLAPHGLRYVGEAGPRPAVVELEDAWGLSAEGMTPRWLDAESALDAALGTRFRRALLARSDADCARPAVAAALAGLAFHADMRCDDELDLTSSIAQDFVDPAGNRYAVAEPELKAALVVLSLAYPQALGYAALQDAAARLLEDFGAAPAQHPSDFAQTLFPLVMAHAVMPTVWTGLPPSEPGTRPRARLLPRLAAASPGWIITGARHVAIDLDLPGRRLLGALDGERTVPELVAWMQGEVARLGWALTPSQVGELVDRQLWLYARQGLLV